MSYRKEISKILYMMAETFRDSLSSAAIDGWVAVLQSENVTVQEARAAAIIVMSSRQYNKLPTPAVFLEIVRPQADHKLTAEAQADEVLEAVRGLGPFDLPTFSDPITDKLMKTRWPWRTFSTELMSDQVKWWRKDFCEAYRDISEAQAREQRLLERREMKALPDAIKGNQ